MFLFIYLLFLHQLSYSEVRNPPPPHQPHVYVLKPLTEINKMSSIGWKE